MTQPPIPPGDPAHIFVRGGDMGRRIMATDWSATPLGPIATWPAALRGALALMLPSCAEIALFWGDDYIALYNDAHASIMGDKHPAALGRPAREVFAELWDDLGALFERVRTGGETVAAKDRPFYIERAGFGETAYFDLSYSPVPLDDGSTGGVLCIVSETTRRVQAARAASVESARLHEMFDHAPGFIAVLREPGHVFELANVTYRRMTGNRPLVGLRYADALPEVAAQGFVDRLDEIVRTGEPFRGTDVAIQLPTDEDGVAREHWVDFICQPVTDAGGAVTSIFIEGIDRTDRHHARRALANSRLALEQAADAGEIAIWEYDLLRDRFSCSPRGWQMYGLPPNGPTLTRAQFGELVHPDDLLVARAAFTRAIDPAIRAPYDVEYRVRGTGGEMRWLAARGRGVFEGEVCVRAIGTLIDVTARRQQAEAWRESEQRFRTLADSLPALVWMTDPDGRIVFASKGCERILGVSVEQAMATGWIPLLRPELQERAAARRADWLAHPAALSGDYPLRVAGGEERWFHAEARPRFVDGLFQGYVACAIDVTEAHLAGERLEARVAERTAELTRQIAERERVEETLHQMQRLEAIGQLTSGVAHDFNNLLTVVLGNVDALVLAGRRGAALDARMLQRVDHIRVAAERGATLTAQLLAFSRRQRLEAKVVDLNDTVRGLSELLGSTLGRLIAIETRLADPIWPALVDPTQMELIILNLAINARDAMPGGGALTVSTANATRGAPEWPEEPPPGDYVCVAVRDTGTGMSDAVLARAFEPFFTTKEVGKGSGLGLAQVFGFAKQSGGGVRIDSVEGEGTVVSVFLPRATAPATAAAEPAPQPAAASLAGRVVLVLDDEDRVREVAVEVLREAGCRVIEAGDGAAALEALAHEPGIELVVADVAMPGMTGVEFAQRAEQVHPGLPVLFVTGYADLSAIVDVPEERLIRKPYPRKLLLERVRALLPAHGTAAPG